MEYAVIETGGKQYRVIPGDIIEIDKISGSEDSISFDKVLLYVSDGEISLGNPHIGGTAVLGKIISSGKGDKVRVSRFTAKSRHRRVIGFRPSITRVEIQKILRSKPSGSAVAKTSPQKPSATAK